ncbi:MAG: aspartate aminotransferase family protein [Rhodospirillum sp.]|nr:aspartate aminotransferase family protein [Rhodospirillum sp.]
MKRPIRLDIEQLRALRAEEVARFNARIPRSNALYAESRGLMPNGVPCSWMAAFYPGTEIFVARGDGATFTDVDGNRYLDMTQCDLSMVCGFGPAPVARAVAERFANGSHFLLPTEDAIAVCRLLRARFGMAAWQFTLSASAANTEAFRIARRATGKDKVLIFSGKYHGHIDETLVRGDAGGASEPDHHGLPRGVEQRTIEVPFNDLDAVERALKGGDVACVLAEPVMTNIGVIHPDDGFHAGLRDLTRRHGALLIIDETHTQVACFGGFTRKWRLEPDILTLGKCVGGGVPIGVYGLTADLSDLVERNTEPQIPVDGKTLAIGGTTYGNALNMAAARAALEAVLTEEGYRRVETLGEALADGIDSLLARHELPGRAYRLGNRSGLCLTDTLPRNAAEAARCISSDLNRWIRPFMANRGVWEPIYIHGPSASFAHTAEDIATYLSAFDEMLTRLKSTALRA